jgi:hypothetical protein
MHHTPSGPDSTSPQAEKALKFEPLTKQERERRDQMRERLVGQNAEHALAFQSRVTYVLGAEAAVFARQLLFWEGRAGDDAGFVWNDKAEWTAQTGLTANAQDRARKVLKARGLLEEHKKSVPPALHYRPNLLRLMEVLEAKPLPPRKENKRKNEAEEPEDAHRTWGRERNGTHPSTRKRGGDYANHSTNYEITDFWKRWGGASANHGTDYTIPDSWK